MTAAPDFRDVESLDPHPARNTSTGGMYVAVIGIDRYRAWGKLQHAVSDARGARDTFLKLGFQEFRPALFDDAATGSALYRLATDELRTLHHDDSLVIFFAGHGHTVTTTYGDGTIAKRGYLIPADAESPGPNIGTWINLEVWLHEIAHLPPRHILVVIDACHSGIALHQVVRWRGEDVRRSEPLAALGARRSRRIITSALDDERAMDSGPIAGHSLFTGCLIEALTGGLQARTGQATTTGSELALHVQRRVSSFPSVRQTPDFGALELDDRGELLIALTEPSRGAADPDLASLAQLEKPTATQVMESSSDSIQVPPSIAPAAVHRSSPQKHRWAARGGGLVLGISLVLLLTHAAFNATSDTSHGASPPMMAIQDAAVADGSSSPPSIEDSRVPNAGTHPSDPRDIDATPQRTTVVMASISAATLKSSAHHLPPPCSPGAAARLAQAEQLRVTNQPKQAITLAGTFEIGSACWEESYRIRAMAHCQLNNIEPASALYQHLGSQVKAIVSKHCQNYGVNF